jgi:hypothetical protein
MWGDVTPAERLRALTRRAHFDDHELAAEAAAALGAFAAEPASLVVACRRLLAHHRAHGALWWVCARVLGAPEPAAAARDAARVLAADRTATRLAAALPLLDEGEVVAVVGWPAAVDGARRERADLDVRALRVPGADAVAALRRRHAADPVRVTDPWDPTLGTVRVLLVPVHAIGPADALVPAGTADAVGALGDTLDAIWLVGGVGRVLPGRLFDALVAAVTAPRAALDAPDVDDDVEVLPLAVADRVVGDRGAERPDDAAARVDCPVVPELLRPLE